MSDPAVKSIPAVFGRLNAEQRAHIVTSMRTILDALTPEERDRSRPTHTWINYWAQEIIDAIAKTEASTR